MSCSWKAPAVTESAAIRSASAMARSALARSAPTVLLTFASPTLRSRIAPEDSKAALPLPPQARSSLQEVDLIVRAHDAVPRPGVERSLLQVRGDNRPVQGGVNDAHRAGRAGRPLVLKAGVVG